MSTSHKFKISYLEMVFPPISSQDAFLFKGEPTIEHTMRQSDFYMIGGKPRYVFENVSFNESSKTLVFTICLGEKDLDKGVIHLSELPFIAARDGTDFVVSVGEAFIDIADGPSNSEQTQLLERFTPESILWSRSRNLMGITGLESFRILSVYDLLYVGIAKVGDSYDRLISKGHQARMDILSNEPQRFPGARVSDEIFLFLFQVTPTIMHTFEPEHEFTDDDLAGKYDHKKVVADAEKAYVSLLKPKYNVMKFLNYPKGKDGLYGAGYDRYGYCIGEAIAFDTAHGRVKGGRHPILGAMSNEADCIFVEGNQANLYVAGVDFQSDEAL
jgi:hypothetical protein